MNATSTESVPDAPDRLSVLGPFRLEVAGHPVALPTRKAESLLAYLALHPEPAGHSRERLAALFWGDSSDADARRSLRVALAGLRKALGGDPFTGDREVIGLDPAFPLWVDALALEGLARRFLVGGAEALAEACAGLYRGDLLADFYDDWLSLPRDRLRGRYQQVLRALVERCRERGDYEAAAEAAQRLLALDPADEAAHQQLMFCYLAQGNRAAALQQYEACARALRDELAVPPSPETVALLRWIRETAPPRAPAARRGNVPLPLTGLIGREDDLATLTALLTPLSLSGRGAGGEGLSLSGRGAGGEGLSLPDEGPGRPNPPTPFPGREGGTSPLLPGEGPGVRSSLPGEGPGVRSRLVTLTGPGGNGKTRLAQATGHALADRFRDGAWWADLVPLADETEIAAAIAGALGLTETPGRPAEDALLDHLAGRQALLILDNCEHMIAAVAGLTARLLSHCPQLRILATSREALGVPGEQAYRVSPLPTPHAGRELTPDALGKYPAIALFVERAAGHQPGFRLTPENGPIIAQICRRLDGIPLAIELAAAQVKVLAVGQIAERLDDRFRLLRGGARTARPRQQTLQALMDWSYDLLTPNEQALFRRLAVFVGGWTLEAAEAVWGEDRPHEAVDLLGRLADKSLIVVNQTADGARYGLLETILAYARQRLADPAEAAAAADAHLAHFLQLAERAEPALRGPGLFGWLARLEREHDNLRTALAWAFSPGADAARRLAGLRLAAALEPFWYVCGFAREGRRWTEEALSRAATDAPDRMVAKAHTAAGTLAWLLGDFDAATAHHQAALAGYRTTDDGRGMAWALGNLAVCLSAQGDSGRALALYAEAADRAQTTGAIWERAVILNNWSAALIDLGRPDEAIPLLETSAALLQGIGDQWAASHPILNLAEIAIQRGEFDRADGLLDDMAALADRLGVESLPPAVNLLRGMLRLYQGQPAAAANAYRASLQGYVEMADRAEATRALEGLALALAALGAGDRAARLLAAAETQRGALASPRSPIEAAVIERCQAQLCQHLPPDVLAAAQEAGRSLTFENAAAEALL